MKESRNFELDHLKKKKRKKAERTTLATWQLSGLVLSRCSFAPLDMLFAMKILKDECYIAIKAYKFTISEILDFFLDILSLVYCMSALSLI